MGEPNATSIPPVPALLPVAYASARVNPEAINYFRFEPSGPAGWSRVASFGQAAVWHRARDLLVQQRIVCRMEDTSTDTDDQRIDLLVMRSEAEWARDILRRGIPDIAGFALPPGGFPVVPVTSGAPGMPPPLPEGFLRKLPAQTGMGTIGPCAALPVAPLRPVTTTGNSEAFTVVLVLAILALILLIASMIVVCFIPGF